MVLNEHINKNTSPTATFSTASQSMASKLTRRYIFALSLIAALILSNGLVMHSAIQQQDRFAAVINVAGAQRMLSQRITLFSGLISSATSEKERDTYRGYLRLAVDRMTMGHQLLTLEKDKASAPAKLSEALQRHYFGVPNQLDKQTRAFLEDANLVLRENNPDLETTARLRAAAAGDYLAQLDVAVSLFQEKSQKRIMELKQLHWAMGALSIVVLLLEALFIFRPTTRQLKRDAEAIEHNAAYDDLSGLLNRGSALQAASVMIEAGLTSGRARFSMIIFEIDFFNEQRRVHGDKIGDAIIAEAGRRIRGLASNDMIVGRIDTSRFMILMPDSYRVEGTLALSDRLSREFNQPFRHDNLQLSASISIGVSCSPDHGKTLDELYKTAHHALAEAKARVAGSIAVFKSSRLGKLLREDDVLAAMEKGEFGGLSIAFQPKVNYNHKTLLGVEALARWRHPVLGDIAPREFLPIAIKYGYIESMGESLRAMALSGFARLRKTGYKIPHLALNFSRQELLNVTGQEMIEAVWSAGLMPADIIIELTEDTILDLLSPEVDAVLEELRTAGMMTSLDDFGSGQASITHLAKQQFNEMKLDQSLIEEMDQPRIANLIAGLADIAKKMDLTVVAEGVENEWQARKLLAIGVDQIQGLYVAPALTEARLKEWMSDSRYAYRIAATTAASLDV